MNEMNTLQILFTRLRQHHSQRRDPDISACGPSSLPVPRSHWRTQELFSRRSACTPIEASPRISHWRRRRMGLSSGNGQCSASVGPSSTLTDWTPVLAAGQPHTPTSSEETRQSLALAAKRISDTCPCQDEIIKAMNEPIVHDWPRIAVRQTIPHAASLGEVDPEDTRPSAISYY
mmetsp:Transcript_3027/g.8754  ORF Transcript_3027/g.8754 Transcript_3027/m.8754 type:complete len:175 (-) Transcript_3027:772-1296(-)|eukprot:CAMPEP_0194510578 /NCGR_PEP_ID=MMETSP0253-20130528/41965_1 /TAXON_ID=2966 /ORGANISM="Noctiluca scintillans" /LENGTH=174 /DNA_ID=CAMNT_0039353833 /DNA_START=91 /DNA_END=615 /DNA_ORIENTATION=+